MYKFKEEFRKNNKGFSLVELMIGMGILAGATLGATKVMEIMNNQARTGEITAALKTTFAGYQKLFENNLNGLSELEFNNGVFYQLDKSTGNLYRLSNALDVTDPDKLKSEWLRTVASTNFQAVYSSLNIVKKSSKNDPLYKRYERYFSVCLPLETALDAYESSGKMTTEVISNVDRFPFIKQTSSGEMQVRCCPLDTPNCDDEGSNPLNETTKYVMRIIRNDYIVKKKEDPTNPGTLIADGPPSEVVKISPNKGSLRNLSGAGFFLYRSGNTLLSYSVFYHSNCVTDKTLRRNQGVIDCKNRFRIQHKLRSFPINTKAGAGATDVGNIGW